MGTKKWRAPARTSDPQSHTGESERFRARCFVSPRTGYETSSAATSPIPTCRSENRISAAPRSQSPA